MAANKKLLVLAGDGIGPEVMNVVFKVIDWMDRRRAGSHHRRHLGFRASRSVATRSTRGVKWDDRN